MTFSVGDRVVIVGADGHSQQIGGVTESLLLKAVPLRGTVVRVEVVRVVSPARFGGSRLSIRRDDGVEGDDVDGSWFAFERHVVSGVSCVVPEASFDMWMVGEAADETFAFPEHVEKKHVMGHDPETVDWEAHRAFLREM